MLRFSMGIPSALVESPDFYSYWMTNIPGMRFEFYDDHIEIRVWGNTVNVPIEQITSVEIRRGLPFLHRFIKINRRPSDNDLAVTTFAKRNVEEIVSLFEEKHVPVHRGGFFL